MNKKRFYLTNHYGVRDRTNTTNVQIYKTNRTNIPQKEGYYARGRKMIVLIILGNYVFLSEKLKL